MPHRDVNGKRRSEAGAHDVRSEPPDPHPLVPPPDTGLDGERARPDAESGGEDREKLPVRCPADGPRAETHAEGGTVEPGETRARRPGTRAPAARSPRRRRAPSRPVQTTGVQCPASTVILCAS